MLALMLGFVLTIFAARLVDLQLLNRTPRAQAAVADRTAVGPQPAAPGAN
jgi:hypothetical protein